MRNAERVSISIHQYVHISGEFVVEEQGTRRETAQEITCHQRKHNTQNIISEVSARLLLP